MRILILILASLLAVVDVSASVTTRGRDVVRGEPAKRAGDWKLIGKNEWQAQLDDAQSSEVTVRLFGKETVMLKVSQKCHDPGDTRERISIEWRYGLTGVREPCKGVHEYTNEGLRELEKNIAPFPQAVEDALRSKRKVTPAPEKRRPTVPPADVHPPKEFDPFEPHGGYRRV